MKIYLKYSSKINNLRRNKHPKLHKYTLRLYKYTVFRGTALHFNDCHFAPQWMLLCIAFYASLYGSQSSNIFLPHIEWVTFCHREFYIPYENQLHSLREYTSFFTGIHFILVRNVVGSRIEHKILSAGNNYFPGLKILYSRQGSASINVRNKFKAISMGIQSILNHFIIKAGVNHHKNRSKISKMRKLRFEEDWLHIWRGLTGNLKTESGALHLHPSLSKCKDFIFLGFIELHVSKKAILSRLWR